MSERLAAARHVTQSVPVRHSSISGGWSSDDQAANHPTVQPQCGHRRYMRPPVVFRAASSRISARAQASCSRGQLPLRRRYATASARLDSRHNGLLVARCAGMRLTQPAPHHHIARADHLRTRVDVAQHYDALRLAQDLPETQRGMHEIGRLRLRIIQPGPSPAAKAQAQHRCWSTVPAPAPLATFARRRPNHAQRHVMTHQRGAPAWIVFCRPRGPSSIPPARRGKTSAALKRSSSALSRSSPVALFLHLDGYAAGPSASSPPQGRFYRRPG